MDQQTSDFVQSIVAGQVRHACTYIAGALVTYGVIAPDQNAPTITVLTGIGVGAVGQIWSIAQKKGLSGIKADLELWKKRALAPAAKTAAALAAFLLLMPASGYAADVNKPAPVFVKAPYAQTNCTQTNCSGGFLGLTIANEGGNLDILGTGLSGVANQTALGIHGGWEFWNGQWYARAKAFANYDISVQSSGAAISDKFAWGGCASLGYSLASAFGIGATGVQQPVVPSALAQSLMTPYINVCGKKQHGQQASGAGAGFEALLATNWTANVDYIHWQYGGGAAADGTVVPSRTSENEVTAGISYHFGAH